MPADIENLKQVMAIILRSGKDIQGEPPKATKEVDADMVTQQVNDKVSKNSRKSEYLKEKVAESEVKKTLPLPFPQKHIKAKEDTLFKKFFDIFRELLVNLPLLDVLQSMSKYAKY